MSSEQRLTLKSISERAIYISQKIKLRYMWALLLFLVIVYVVYNSLFYNSDIFQISSTLITIYVISLTMYTSNKELHKASSQQAESFNQSINKLSDSANVFRGLLESYGDYFKKFLEGQKQDQMVKEREIELKARPDLYFSPFLYKWGWGDFVQKLKLRIDNTGGYASDIIILAGPTERRINVQNLGRNMYTEGIDCGDPRETGGEVIQIKVYLEDILHRKYFAEFRVDFSQNGRVQVPLTLII